MKVTFKGVCENCGETATVTTTADQTPNTCPICGGSTDYEEIAETSEYWED